MPITKSTERAIEFNSGSSALFIVSVSTVTETDEGGGVLEATVLPPHRRPLEAAATEAEIAEACGGDAALEAAVRTLMPLLSA
jgi:hypothetical protein